MKFERITYPDGQISAKLISKDYPGRVVQRINSYEDLFFVRSIAEILQHQNGQADLFIPCLFGQRSDRRFVSNQSFDLKIIAEVINACKFRNVEILDPHSDVALALINNSEKSSARPYVDNTVRDLRSRLKGSDQLVFISPDAGAYKKVFEFGDYLQYPVISAVKHRQIDGEITSSFTGNVKGKHCLIIDDLCDGGTTFIQLATQLRKALCGRVFLYVTHGYFSKGFHELSKVVDHIYCTNSVKDMKNDFITQFKVVF